MSIKSRLLMCAALTAFGALAETVVIEAESFDDWGGWVNDTQFMDQMGSPYLLAHGLGKPVADAKTTVNISEAAEYHVWVRTKNWMAGVYAAQGLPVPESPAGAFELLVNGTPLPLKTVLGTQGKGEWLWVKASRVVLAGQVTLTLHDLDGFDGRCDAIVLTTDDVKPMFASRSPVGKPFGQYDLVVVGGGIAGVCTAVSAARLGLRTALVHDRPVLGGNNSSEVRVHLGAYQNLPPYPRLGDVLAEFGPKAGGNAREASVYEDDRKLAVVKGQKNLDLFLNEHVNCALTNENGCITAVVSRNTRTGESTGFLASWFVDCTGDGTVGYLAGADYRMGREAKSETNELDAPEKADMITMGASVQWYAGKTGGDAAFPFRPWMLKTINEANCSPHLKGDWWWEAGLGRDQIKEGEYIRDYGLLVAFSNWAFVKNGYSKKDAFADKELKWVAYNAGRRESRRLLGDFILDQNHLRNKDFQPDGTCATTWTIDLHLPKTARESKFEGEPYQSNSLNETIWPYPIPYRCLYSRNVPNLFMAGRDISVTHIALGTTRLMRTHGMMGEVVGMAASICKKHNCNPRDVYTTHLDELKELMTKGVGDGTKHPRQDYNCQQSLDPTIKARYEEAMKGLIAEESLGSFRPPAVPLVACDPFFSVWSPHDRLTDGETTHWAVWKKQPLNVTVRTGGAEYRLCGTEPASAKALRQVSCEVRPLTTVVSYEGDDGLAATLEFLTAKDPSDLETFSRPVTYVTAKVTGADVWSLRVWFGPNICREDENAQVTTNSFVVSRHHPGVWLGRTEQRPLSASGDTVRCDWGYAWTVDCGDHFVLAYDDVKSIRWFDKDLDAYWRRNGRTFESMLADSVRDYAAVRERADRKDAELMSAFRRRGGEKYARLCSLAWRQSFAACKLVVGPKGELFYFSKENGSNGCIGTVDVFYPQMPLLLYSSKELVRATLRPILEYASSGRWPYDYAPHDIGQYPLATGQVYGMGNDSHGRPYGDADRMPVEECGNMLISLAALAQREGNADFAGRYWPTVVKWAEYLSRFGFDPGDQLCTDDFAGHLAHNANLSLKSILAIRSYAMLAEMREKAQGGGSGESEKWRRDAERMAKSWMDAAKGGRDGATRLAFDQADTWSLKYNLVWDRVLGFNLFPAEVARGETAAYRKFANDFGVPLDSRRTYTKSDWIMWCAAMAEDRADFDALVSGIYRFANETPSRVPLSDWYETVGEGRFVAFIARSVVGGFLMPML